MGASLLALAKSIYYKVTWLGGILIPKFLNTMRVEGFKWEKNTRPQTTCLQDDEQENKTKENTKSIMFVFHAWAYI